VNLKEQVEAEMDEQFIEHIKTMRPMKRADYRRAARAAVKEERDRLWLENVLRRKAKGLST